jgi:hypothetical protein
MRIVQLTEQEAANSAVMENVSRYLLTGEPIADTLVTSVSRTPDKELAVEAPMRAVGIGIDAPDVGTATPEVPLASPFAAIGFGSAAVPSPATAPEGSAPSPDRRASLVNAPVAQSLSHAGVDLDKTGLYWDERIHSSSKDKNADGTWRKKRGVEKTLGADGIAKVEAEIRAVLAIPGPSVPPVPSVPVPPTVPTPPTVPDVPTPPAATEPEPSGQAFMRWMEDLTPDMQPGGRFTPELMNKLLVAQGLPPEAGLMAFVQRPDLVPAARAMLDVWMADPSQVPQ